LGITETEGMLGVALNLYDRGTRHLRVKVEIDLRTIAEAAGIGVFPGNHPTTSVGAAAAAHVCAVMPNLSVVGDFHAGACEWIEDDVVVVSPLRVEGRYVQVPEGPCLGMDLDESKISRYRIDA
jgi:L-alanine-DL-glutamate epimerase-like enolase superfamily enzyme